MRSNQVNAAVRLPERQVLPRGIDHGADLADLQAQLSEGDDVHTLVLDLKDAFMSIPVDAAERRFNCAHTGFDLKRKRSALFEGEPVVGRFVVYRVLGFGGKPNPLIFARVVSLASRTAQALLGPADLGARGADCCGLAAGRLQFFVDGPVLWVRRSSQCEF